MDILKFYDALDAIREYGCVILYEAAKKQLVEAYKAMGEPAEWKTFDKGYNPQYAARQKEERAQAAQDKTKGDTRAAVGSSSKAKKTRDEDEFTPKGKSAVPDASTKSRPKRSVVRKGEQR